MKHRRRGQEREQHKYVALTRPGTKCPPPIPQAQRDEYTRTIARALAAETLTLERTLSDLVNRACGL